MLERLASDKQTNLLGQFLSYEENEVFWIRTKNLKKNYVAQW